MTPSRQSTARRWTADEHARMLDLFAAGKSVDEVAAALDRTPGAVSSRCALVGVSPGALRERVADTLTLPASEIARLRAIEAAARSFVADTNPFLLDRLTAALGSLS